jgi:glyoxylase-like metal-dependent hydrolase (beta-lactamase superfamily II)
MREGLTAIDLGFQGLQEVIAAYLFQDSGQTALIEIGPTSSFETLLEGIRHSGVDPADISKVLVTHIHLDHAGASGTFLHRFPGAKLYVHERGVRHMVDPSRLIASATRIYGNMMERLWGTIEPVPADSIVSLTDSDTVSVGATQFQAIYTPGHASHHVAYHDAKRGEVFTGDVAAVRLPGHEYVRPPTPPPDIDLPVWSESIDRILALRAKTLYLTHFGKVTDVDQHLKMTRERLFAWTEMVRHGMKAGKSREEIIEQLRAYGDEEILQDAPDPSATERYEMATPYYMSVDGLLRYLSSRELPRK